MRLMSVEEKKICMEGRARIYAAVYAAAVNTLLTKDCAWSTTFEQDIKTAQGYARSAINDYMYMEEHR